MSTLTDGLAWAVVLGFGVGAGLAAFDAREWGRYVVAATWGLFGAFWLVLFPTFAFEMRSFVEGALSLAAVPLCLHAGYLTLRGRDGLFVLSRAIAVMGLVYLPVETIPFVRRFLVETVAAQTHAGITALGYDPLFTERAGLGYRNEFVFEDASGNTFTTYIVTACTGIGSMAIFGGLLAAVRAPLRRRLVAVATAVGVIWVLNIVRNVFIAVAFGDQWFQHDLLVGLVVPSIYEDPHLTSYFLADRVISQGLSVVALVGITLLVVRRVPELLSVLEDALYVATRREVSLGEFLGVDGDGRTAPAGGEVSGGD